MHSVEDRMTSKYWSAGIPMHSCCSCPAVNIPGSIPRVILGYQFTKVFTIGISSVLSLFSSAAPKPLAEAAKTLILSLNEIQYPGPWIDNTNVIIACEKVFAWNYERVLGFKIRLGIRPLFSLNPIKAYIYSRTRCSLSLPCYLRKYILLLVKLKSISGCPGASCRSHEDCLDPFPCHKYGSIGTCCGYPPYTWAGPSCYATITPAATATATDAKTS